MIIYIISAFFLKKHSRAGLKPSLWNSGLPLRLTPSLFIVPFLFLSLILFLPLSSHGNAPNSSSVIKKTAYRLARDLGNKMELTGKIIQVSNNNFWQRDTKINLPFSSVLRDALATALSRRGATVTVQEVGAEPLRLLGTYAIEGDNVVITARIRSMGETVSKDLSVAQRKVRMTSIDPGWFKQDLSHVARTLVRILEDNYHGLHDLDVKINPFKPGPKGKPPLLLGLEFQKFLETAMSDSALFRPWGITTGVFPAIMEGTYSIFENKIRFYAGILDSQGRTVTSAMFDVEDTDIPSDLLKIMAPVQIRVCMVYTPVSSKDPLVNSPAADQLIEYITEALVKHGIEAERCSPENRGCIRVEVCMKLRENRTEDGYGIATGQLQIKVVDSNGKTMGTLPREAKSFFRNNLNEGAEKIAQEIFTDEKVGAELASIILAR